MEIQVIGRGVVGEATGETLRRLGHDVWYFDVDEEVTDVEAPRDADMHFVCVPEGAVEVAVADLCEECRPDVVFVRSTVPVGTVDSLDTYFDPCVFHFPEFLRERQSLMDEWTPSLLVVGTPKNARNLSTDTNGEEAGYEKHIRTIKNLYSEFLTVDVTTAKNTELLKLAMNGFFSTLVSFWNEMHLVANAVGANSHEVALLARNDSRVPVYGTLHGDSFGGRCLPKDLKQLIGVAEEHNVEPQLLKAVESVNNKMGTTKKREEVSVSEG